MKKKKKKTLNNIYTVSQVSEENKVYWKSALS